MRIRELSDAELFTARAQCHLLMARMGGAGGPEMDKIQARLDELDAEHNRRHSIFNGSFQGGV